MFTNDGDETTIRNDVGIGSYTADDAVSSLLKKWGTDDDEDQGEPVSESGDGPNDSQDDESGDEGEEARAGDDDSDTGSDGEDGGEPGSRKEAPDDAIVRYKVGDEEFEIPVKDLKRLAGQEKALTQRSQQLAEQRKQYEQNAQMQAVALDRLMQNATERFKPYQDIDWVMAAAKMEPEEYAQLREDAQTAWRDVQFLQQEVGGFLQKIEEDRKVTLQARAREAMKTLTDPVEGIPGFNREVYQDIRSFAISNGLPEPVVDSLVDPAALKIIYKAMQFDKGASAGNKVVRRPKTPTKVVSKAGASESVAAAQDRAKSAMRRLRTEKTAEAAVDALVARWADDD
jgi:hypothetical protein